MALKRLMDLCAAAGGLAVLSPFLLVLAALIKLTSPGPVVFKQPRPGKGAKIFDIYKFRTMREAKDKRGRPLPDGQRMTGVGNFMRKLSLDEIPELWNVLKGDMSLIGPRPLLVQYLDRYSPEEARRHETKPGITGWAQVNGRNAITWEQKFAYDIWYVDHWSLRLDIKILFLTVNKVLRSEGISQPGHATMEEFQGHRREP
jgi:lipopolysaccharide/colanic/teichoic acid biosynthesis glycosyltransferase